MSILTDQNTDSFKLHSIPNLNSSSSDQRAYISTFGIIAASSRPPRTNASAALCSLWLCLKAYDTKIVDGLLEQHTVNTWNDTRLEEENSAHLTEHVFVNIPDNMNTASQSRYSVTLRAAQTLNAFLDFLLEGTYEKAHDIVNFSSDWSEAVWDAVPDLQAWLDKLTLSLTNEMREHGQVRDTHDAKYEGQATHMVDFVHVKWFWIMYQPLFLLLTVYYLFTTVVAAARDQVAVWKNDSMPMLFARIHPDIQALGYGKMDTHKGLDDLGKHGVALVREDDGLWTFVPTHKHEHRERFEGLLRTAGIRRW